MRFRAGRYMGV